MCLTVFVGPLNHDVAILFGKLMEFVVKKVFGFNFTSQMSHIHPFTNEWIHPSRPMQHSNVLTSCIYCIVTVKNCKTDVKGAESIIFLKVCQKGLRNI